MLYCVMAADSIKPACPMNAENQNPLFPPKSTPVTSQKESSCPVKSSNHPIRNLPLPVKSSSLDQKPETSATSKLNPLNYMPALSNKQEYTEQTTTLPLERENLPQYHEVTLHRIGNTHPLSKCTMPCCAKVTPTRLSTQWNPWSPYTIS